jgi:type I restriction enzyme S subunit
LGVSISKHFMPSVANAIGTDLTKYKVIRRYQFACSRMQVSRDEKIPIDCLMDYEIAIVSPDYYVFEIADTEKLMSEYLSMWFKRSEFDREASFLGTGGVRGSMAWNDFCCRKLPVPPPDKQRAVVKAYQTITDRIALKRTINQKVYVTKSRDISAGEKIDGRGYHAIPRHGP